MGDESEMEQGRFLTQDLGDEIVILDVEDRLTYALNETAALAFRSFVKGQSVEDVVRALVERSEVPPETVRADIERLLADFAEKGLTSCFPGGGHVSGAPRG